MDTTIQTSDARPIEDSVALQVPNQQETNITYNQPRILPKKTNYRDKLVVSMEKRTEERNALIKNLLSKEDEDDDIDLFFKSIAKSVKKLGPALQQRAKLQTLNIVSELELQMWNSSSGIVPSPANDYQCSISSHATSSRSNSCETYLPCPYPMEKNQSHIYSSSVDCGFATLPNYSPQPGTTPASVSTSGSPDTEYQPPFNNMNNN